MKFHSNDTVQNDLYDEKYSLCLYTDCDASLPRPLSAAEEKEAIATGNRSLLIERNLRLVVYIAKRFESSGVMMEDLISIGTIGLIKAVNTFDLEKNFKLATYASRCIENEILMYLRKGLGSREISLDEPLNVDFDGNELLLSDVLFEDEDCVCKFLEAAEEKIALHKALSTLSKRENQIISMRYGLYGKKPRTQKEVADALGISQSYISRLEKRIINTLRERVGG